VAAAYSYPSQLQGKLGKAYSVKNFGVSSTTANGKGNFPYIGQSAYQNALLSNPDIVIIMLGTNDAKAVNRTPALASIFKAEYASLIQSFVDLPTRPQVYIVTPVDSIARTGSYANHEYYLSTQIRPEIRELAAELGLPVIEFESKLKNASANYISDGLHPSRYGYDIMSSAFYDYIVN
jgi:lysophospholipase L1-like esterase